MKLYQRDGTKKVLLATFTLVKGKVKSEWEKAGEGFQQHIEVDGIQGRKGRFKPADGKAFMTALGEAFQRSTFLFVR